MRSALIIASFALTLLAAPVPVAEGQAPARRDFTDNPTPIETTIDKRYIRNGKDSGLIGSRAVSEQETEVEKPASSLKDGRSEASAVEVETRGYRAGVPREAETEKRGYRAGVPREAEVEARGYRAGVPRAAEPEAEVEKRGYRAESPRRSIYDGVVGIIETLKTRGFDIAGNIPARQPM